MLWLTESAKFCYMPNFFSATRKRFYKTTGVIQSDNKWEVTLDNRRLKTPNRSQLVINNEQLARAIAVEWDSQCDIIAQPIMHLVFTIFIYLSFI